MFRRSTKAGRAPPARRPRSFARGATAERGPLPPAGYLDDLQRRAGGQSGDGKIHPYDEIHFSGSIRRTDKADSRTDEQVVKLAGEITDKLLEQTAVLFKHYPRVTGLGRPLRSCPIFRRYIN